MRIQQGYRIALMICFFISACTPAPPQPTKVILMISDGCGPASFTLARDYMREILGQEALALDPLLVGSVATFASDSRVTDSAASATAYACGIKTYNGAIAVDTLREIVPTILEAAEVRGLSTGLVATSRITHATPAAFSAHVPNRGMENEIAEQQIAKGIEVLLGGGKRHFLPQAENGRRNDGRNLLTEAEAKGYQVIQTREAFDALTQTPVLGLFGDDHMAYEIDRDPTEQPSLAEMTEKAIALLNTNDKGFFLMVEGSRIDHAAHQNDLGGHLHDILAYDAAVAVALEFAKADGNTLLISVSDHETGGLSLGRRLNGRGVYNWEPAQADRIRGSYEQMFAAYREGMSAEEVLDTYLPFSDLTDEERRAFTAATAENNTWTAQNALTAITSPRAIVGWTTDGHTAVDVNLYAFGPGRERFIGHYDNTYIGRTLIDLLGLDLQAVSLTP